MPYALTTRPVYVNVVKILSFGLLPTGLCILSFGTSAKTALIITVSIFLQIAAGSTLWILANSNRAIHTSEVLGVGLALGTISATIGAQLLLPIMATGFVFVLPSVLSLTPWLFRWTRERLIGVLTLDTHRGANVLLFFYGGALSLIMLIPFFNNNPQRSNGAIIYSRDIPWFEAISHSVVTWGNSNNPLAAHMPFRYHWFTYAWAGWENLLSGSEPFIILTRVLPLVSTAGIILLIIAFVQIQVNQTLAAIIALTISILGAEVVGLGNPGSIITPVSPSQLLTVVWLLAAALTFLRFIGDETSWFLGIFTFACLSFGSVAGKATTSPVLGGGIFAILLLLVARREKITRAIIALLVYLVTTILGYLLILSGANNKNLLVFGSGMFQLFDLPAYQDQIPSIGRGLVGGIIIGIAGTVGLCAKTSGLTLMIRPLHRISPITVFSFGGLLSGTILTAFTYQASAPPYFLLAGLALAAPSAGVGIYKGMVVSRNQKTKFEAPLLVIGIAIAGAFYIIRFEFLGISARSFGFSHLVFWVFAPLVVLIGAYFLSLVAQAVRFVVRDGGNFVSQIGYHVALILTIVSVATGVVYPLGDNLLDPFNSKIQKNYPGYQSGFGWTHEHEVALNWLKGKTSNGDIIATNRFCAVGERPPDCDSGSLAISALTGRRMFLEGYYYEIGNKLTLHTSWNLRFTYDTNPTPDWVLERMKLSLQFSTNPNLSSWSNLRSYGVTWFVIDKAFPHTDSWVPYGVVRYQNRNLILIQLSDRA